MASTLTAATGPSIRPPPLLDRLRSWVADVLGDVSISPAPPGQALPDGRCIGLYLMELGPAASTPRSGQTAPLQLRAHVLVTAWGPEPSGTHDDLCDLAFSAMEMPEFEVDLSPLAAPLWSALGTPPRPAFRLSLPLRRTRTAHPGVATVRSPLVLTPAAMVSLKGRLVGPGDVPIAGARIELPALGRAAQTDHGGRFAFAGMPAGQTLNVRVQARGVSQEFTLQASADPVVMRFQLGG